MPSDLEDVVRDVIRLEGIRLAGIGTSLACFGGVLPDDRNMAQLSNITQSVEDRYGITLEFVSCGNSSVYCWLKSTKNLRRINNVRLGESLLLGCKDLECKGIPGLLFPLI